MSGLKAKYQGTDFNEWYKANYNGAEYSPDKGLTRAEGMSDVDWRIGESLYDSYKTDAQRKQNYESNKSDVQNKYAEYLKSAQTNRDYTKNEAQTRADETLEKLQKYYDLSNETLDNNKKRSQQNASITLDRLKKYLPEQIKAQGLGGLGVSESSMLNAYNSYLNSMGDISNEYQKNKTDLETNYLDNRGNVISERDSALRNADNEYASTESGFNASKQQELSALERAYSEANLNAWQTAKNNVSDIYNQYEQEYKDGQDKLYNDGRQALEEMYLEFVSDDGKISQSEYDKLKSYADNIGNIGDGNKTLLDNALKGYSGKIRSTKEQTERDYQDSLKTPTVRKEFKLEGKENTANGKEGDNFKISGNDTTYCVEKGKTASDEVNDKLVRDYTTNEGSAPAVGAAMLYGGKLYMYLPGSDKQNRWTIVQQRKNSKSDDFKKLCEALGVNVYSRGSVDYQAE